MKVFSTLVPLAWAAFWLYWLISAQGAKPDARRDAPMSRALQLILSLAAYALLVPRWWQWSALLTLRRIRSTIPLTVAGAALLLPGLGFSVWARIHLGAYWSGRVAIKEDHKLVRTGPYARVRNPIYTGLIFALLGAASMEPQFRSAVALVVFCAGIFVKIKAEERFLSERFGEEYRQYCEETKAIIPFLI